ncbi:MAG TPA: hypothetical protein VF459_18030 [Caulobacteraceae bacterium]
MTKAQWSPALKRYQARFWPTMIVYALVLWGAIHLLQTGHPAGLTKYALAVAPAVPTLAVIAILGRYLVEETDEFRRMLTVQSMLWGLAFILAVTTVWGFLEGMADAPHIPMFYVFPAFCAGMGLSQPFLAWRYR